MISFFRAPIKNITPEAQVSILQIYKYITGGYAKLTTDRLRSITDPATARRYKGEMLDYVTFSGCFSSRRTGELIEHSGFLCFDIDKIESEKWLQEIKTLLINDEELHTVLCFRSPSGNGLKWVVEVPDRVWLCQTQITDDRVKITDVIVKNHRVLYERIRGYLFEQYGIATDHTSDIARPCYLCHDADAYYDEPTFRSNPASRFLKSTDDRVQITHFARDFYSARHNEQALSALANRKNIQITDKNSTNYENDIEKIVQNIEHRRIDITNAYHDWMLVAMALAGTYGSAGEQYFHRISQFHPKYNHTEAHRMYQSCVRNTHGAVGIGTIVYLIHNA